MMVVQLLQNQSTDEKQNPKQLHRAMFVTPQTTKWCAQPSYKNMTAIFLL